MILPKELQKAAKKAAFRAKKRRKKAAKKAAKNRPFSEVTERSESMFYSCQFKGKDSKHRVSGRKGKILLHHRDPMTDKCNEVLIFQIDANCI